jgi:hypothetical protein
MELAGAGPEPGMTEERAWPWLVAAEPDLVTDNVILRRMDLVSSLSPPNKYSSNNILISPPSLSQHHLRLKSSTPASHRPRHTSFIVE